MTLRPLSNTESDLRITLEIDLDSLGQRRHRVSLIWINAGFDYGKRDGAIHRTGIDVHSFSAPASMRPNVDFLSLTDRQSQ